MNQEMPQSTTPRKDAPASLSVLAKVALAASIIVSAAVLGVFAPNEAPNDSSAQPPVRVYAERGEQSILESISSQSSRVGNENVKSGENGIIPDMVASPTEEEYLAMFRPSEMKPVEGPNLIVMNPATENPSSYSKNSKTTAKEPEELNVTGGGTIDEELGRVLARFPNSRKNRLGRWNEELERPEKIAYSEPDLNYSSDADLVPLARTKNREPEILVPISPRAVVYDTQ